MKFKFLILAALAAVLSCSPAFGQATILPPGETCFSALAPTSGGPANTGTGFIGLLGTITGGSGYTNGTYGGVALTGGSGTNATANITVSGGVVSAIAILNPGQNYVVGDTLSAPASSIGGSGSGFSVPVSSVSLNYALAGGSVGFYIPNTLTYKQTWQDSGETTPNTNPVTLDANGCAVVYGSGIYRMIVKDSLGNTAYDKLTASTGPSGVYWAGTAGGTGNAITVTDSGFANQDGATIQFRANATNSGAATVSVSGGAAIPIVKDTPSGPSTLTGSEIANGAGGGNTPMVTYDAVNSDFHLLNPSSTSGGSGSSSTLVFPQGYLNLVGQASGDVVQTGDVVGATTLYYSPFVGSIVPIFSGSSFVNSQISELTLTLTASGSPSNTIQDACIFSNNGTATLVLGPSWTTVTAGNGNRGTGAGTAQISRLQGIWVNAVSIIGYNGSNSYSIPASQCTYVGTVDIDATAGQISSYRSFGQSRKLGVWNAYNRQPIVMQTGDPGTSWNNTSASVRPSDNNANNSITLLSGLPEDPCTITNTEFMGIKPDPNSAAHQSVTIGIGYNSTSVFSGTQGRVGVNANANTTISNWVEATATATYTPPPSIGIEQVTALEQGNSAANVVVLFYGTQADTVMQTSCRG